MLREDKVVTISDGLSGASQSLKKSPIIKIRSAIHTSSATSLIVYQANQTPPAGIY
jgi:hypothetical protein